MNQAVYNDLKVLGQRIQQTRKMRKFTLEELANKAGVSKALISKIENYRTVPSLPVLIRIATSMDIDVGELVKGLGSNTLPPHIVSKASERSSTERDDSFHFFYEMLISRAVGNIFFDSHLLTLAPDSKRSQVTTEGHQFVFMTEGAVDFVIGQETYHLEKGDAMFFDGRIPHVPQCASPTKAQMLAIYLLKSENG